MILAKLNNTDTAVALGADNVTGTMTCPSPSPTTASAPSDIDGMPAAIAGCAPTMTAAAAIMATTADATKRLNREPLRIAGLVGTMTVS